MSTPVSAQHETRFAWPSWLWVGMLCFVRGLMAMAILIAVLMYKRLGVSDAWATMMISLLLVPVVVRPLYGGQLVRRGTLKRWVIGTEVAFAVAMMMVADAVTTSSWEWMAWLWLLVAALAWAIHGLAADELCYSQLAGERRRRVETGSCVYAVAMMLTGGMMLMITGNVEVISIGNVETVRTEDLGLAWAAAYKVGAAVVVICMAALLLMLPANIRVEEGIRTGVTDWLRQARTVATDMAKWPVAVAILLLVFSQEMIVEGVPLFLVSQSNIGGLALAPQEAAFVWFTVGLMAFALGMAIGVRMMGEKQLRWWRWPIVALVALSDVLYVYLAYSMTTSLTVVCLCVLAEQLLCGLGVAAFWMAALDTCRGRYGRERFHALASLAALTWLMMGVLTGGLQEYMGFRRFFVLVLLVAIAAVAAMAWLLRPEGEEDDND